MDGHFEKRVIRREKSRKSADRSMLSRSSGKRWRCAAPTGMRDALARAAVGPNASATNHAAGGELSGEECPWFRSDDSARQEFSSLFTEIFSAASSILAIQDMDVEKPLVRNRGSP